MGTKRDLIAAELRRQISSGALARGSKVSQEELAKHFSTSITPVREALGLLQAEGFLVAEPHQGVRVATADLGQVRTVYLLRQLVEPYVMQRSVWNMSPRDLHATTELHALMSAAIEADDAETYNDLNRDFHFSFFDRCDDAGLRSEMSSLWQRYPWDLLRVLDTRSERSHQEHTRILEATRVGDLEEVAQATREHLRTGYLALAEYLSGAPMPDPFSSLGGA